MQGIDETALPRVQDRAGENTQTQRATFHYEPLIIKVKVREQ